MNDWWHKLPYSRVKSWWLRWPDLLQNETPWRRGYQRRFNL